jgi:hypothetical protein
LREENQSAQNKFRTVDDLANSEMMMIWAGKYSYGWRRLPTARPKLMAENQFAPNLFRSIDLCVEKNALRRK